MKILKLFPIIFIFLGIFPPPNSIYAEGKDPNKDNVLEYLVDKLAKWWMPDDVVFVDEIPHTATGKIQKLTLREQFADYELPTA